MSCNSKPINGRPNAMDDDTINRGITGQSLRDKSMNYDPATGKPTGGMDVNLGMGMGGECPCGDMDMDGDYDNSMENEDD